MQNCTECGNMVTYGSDSLLCEGCKPKYYRQYSITAIIEYDYRQIGDIPNKLASLLRKREYSMEFKRIISITEISEPNKEIVDALKSIGKLLSEMSVSVERLNK